MKDVIGKQNIKMGDKEKERKKDERQTKRKKEKPTIQK
jgi:hypothetical protein